jgi:ankyrin repeat protein
MDVSRETRFFAAVDARDLTEVRRLLAEEPPLIRARDASGATALHYAAFSCDRELAELLLAAGADVNSRDAKHGATPTGWAAEFWRERGGLLAFEIDDVLFAIRRGDEEWVARLVGRHPALRHAMSRDGVPLALHAKASGNPAILRPFEDGT